MNAASVTAQTATFRSATARFAPGVIAPALVNLAGAAVFTRLFSTDEFGRYALALIVSVTLVSVATQWLQQGVLRFLPGAAGTEARELRTGIALGALGLGITAAALALFAALTLAPFITPEARPLLLPALLFVLAGCIYQCVRAVLQADLRSSEHSAYQAALALGGFAIALTAALATDRVAALLWGPAIATALLAPLLWRTARLPSPARVLRSLQGARAALRPLGVYGWPMTGWFAGTLSVELTSRTIIELLRGSGAVGVYSASYTLIMGGAGLIVLPLNLALHPLLMRSLSRGDLAQAADMMRRLWNAFLAGSVILVGWTLLLAPVVAGIVLGPAFRDGYRIMPVVLAGALTWQLGMVAHKPLEWRGRTILMLVLGIALALANAVLTWVGVSRFGYVGAAWATALCYAGYTAAALVAGRRSLDWSPDAAWGAITILIGAAGFAAAHALADPASAASAVSATSATSATSAATPAALAAGYAIALATTALVLLTRTPWARTAALPWRRSGGA